MRRIFVDIIKDIVIKDEKSIFLTGDLGFNALEDIRNILKDRFINMGVAEQTMISVAAGIAYKGYQVFCYSIAPFITYRCLEQIRNDVCFHNMPVYLIGNGGGYGYGIMGSSHHAIEDIAILSGLPNMHCYIPSFDEDIENCVKDIVLQKRPAYLRLGLARSNNFFNKPNNFFNKLTNCKNPKITIIGSGAVIHNIFDAIKENNFFDNVDVFNISKIPFGNFPDDFIKSVKQTKKLIVVEEHISIGGIGQQIAHDILTNEISISVYKTLFAKGYPDQKYGDQQYHMKQSGIDKNNISKLILNLLQND